MARILIADDDPHILRVMSIWLERHGHDVVHCRNGREALDAIAAGQAPDASGVSAGAVDLVISDMNMPKVDGVELAVAVRNGPQGDIPILMLTARCDQQDLNERLSAYSVRVFPKPFLPSQLVAEINRLLRPQPQGSGTC